MKRSGPLARKTPLARASKPMARSPMRGSRPKGQPAERSDRPYLAWLRKQPCCMCSGRPPCHAHHPRTGAGVGLKSADQGAISLCAVCHHDLHALAGHFEGLPRAGLREWEELKARQRRAEYERESVLVGRRGGKRERRHR